MIIKDKISGDYSKNKIVVELTIMVILLLISSTALAYGNEELKTSTIGASFIDRPLVWPGTISQGFPITINAAISKSDYVNLVNYKIEYCSNGNGQWDGTNFSCSEQLNLFMIGALSRVTDTLYSKTIYPFSGYPQNYFVTVYLNENDNCWDGASCESKGFTVIPSHSQDNVGNNIIAGADNIYELPTPAIISKFPDFAASEELNQIMTVEEGTIIERITNTNGNGIANANLYASGVSWSSATTNSTGHYILSNLGTDAYNVNVDAPPGSDYASNYTRGIQVIGGTTTQVDFVLPIVGRIAGDLNGNGQSADAGDLVLMKRASIGEIIADSSYDLNNNGQFAYAGDLVLMKRASIGEINL